ncbi:MAG: chemotaxis protein CheW [Mycobacteriales bacterium]
MTGLVTFRLGAREYATPLSDVREVVRLEGLADLPGMTPPLAGVLDLRGTALPVLDLRRGATSGRRGDVLVLERGRSDGREGLVDGSTVGVAVDQVRAVVPREGLTPAGAAPEAGVLPAYVVEVLRGADGIVFLVDLARMVDSVRQT